MTVLEYLLVGLAAGTLAGLLGIGGGALLVPLLILGFKFPTKQAVAISLSSMVFTATAGALAHLREGNLTVHTFKYAALIGLGAAAGAVLGAHIVARVSALFIRRLFAAFLIIVALRLALAPGEKKRKEVAANEGRPVCGLLGGDAEVGGGGGLPERRTEARPRRGDGRGEDTRRGGREGQKGL